jgi:hypothetical protein
MIRRLNGVIRKLAAITHGFQFRVEGVLRPHFEWFDHELDAQWQWPRRGSITFLERGILSRLAFVPDAEVLELCSGDGFITKRFYSRSAKSIVAVDRSAEAVAHARRFHAATNIDYRVGDIREALPDGPFSNVVWNAAMHHFTASEIAAVIDLVRERLQPGGVLSGDIPIDDSGYVYARSRFSGPEDVAAQLSAFDHVAVLDLPSENRRNLYFFASDDPQAVPFSAEDSRVTRIAHGSKVLLPSLSCLIGGFARAGDLAQPLLLMGA